MNKTKILKLVRRADTICRKNKKCDRENVLHALICLEQKPLKRLEMSIRRANLAFFAGRS